MSRQRTFLRGEMKRACTVVQQTALVVRFQLHEKTVLSRKDGAEAKISQENGRNGKSPASAILRRHVLSFALTILGQIKPRLNFPSEITVRTELCGSCGQKVCMRPYLIRRSFSPNVYHFGHIASHLPLRDFCVPN